MAKSQGQMCPGTHPAVPAPAKAASPRPAPTASPENKKGFVPILHYFPYRRPALVLHEHWCQDGSTEKLTADMIPLSPGKLPASAPAQSPS